MSYDPSLVRPPIDFDPNPRRKSGMVKAFEGRWRYWYEAIADHLIANPGAKVVEIAAAIRKHPNSVSAVMGTDNFKTFFALRKQQWRDAQDFGLRKKMHAVAEEGLDVLLETIQKKRTNVPMEVLAPTVGSILDKLGYGTKSGPQVQVNLDQRQQVIAPVSVDQLNEAREALRRAEAARAVDREATPQLAAPSNEVEAFDDLDLPTE